jgi:hypothetical protein
VGFNAASVPKLDWDFSTWVPDARGITPEPSQKIVDQFTEGLMGLAGEVGGLSALGDNAAMGQAVRDELGDIDLDSEEGQARLRQKVDELNGELFAVIADLTQGSPSRPQLEQLQAAAPRVFNAYLGWLVGTLRPEAGSSATTA